MARSRERPTNPESDHAPVLVLDPSAPQTRIRSSTFQDVMRRCVGVGVGVGRSRVVQKPASGERPDRERAQMSLLGHSELLRVHRS